MKSFIHLMAWIILVAFKTDMYMQRGLNQRLAPEFILYHSSITANPSIAGTRNESILHNIVLSNWTAAFVQDEGVSITGFIMSRDPSSL